MNVLTAALGDIKYGIESVSASIVGNSIQATIEVDGLLKSRYVAPYVNGVYKSPNIWVSASDEPITFCRPMEAGTAIGSIWLADAGLWPDWSCFVEDPYAGEAANFDSQTANRLKFVWQQSYAISAIEGEGSGGASQLSISSITGAARGVNLGPGSLPTRGSLTYSVSTTGASRTITFFAGAKSVSAWTGTTSDTAFATTQVLASGLVVTGTIAYTQDVIPGITRIELMWPKSYNLYWSPSPLSFPSAIPMAYQLDTNGTSYLYQTPSQSGSAYWCAVVAVDDQGHSQYSGVVPVQVALTNTPPAPTDIYATGNAAALTINWTPGEPDCEYRVCYGIGNEINFGDLACPPNMPPLLTAYNATSLTLPPIPGPYYVDRTAFLSAMENSIDSVVANMQSSYSSGETGFLTAIATAQASIISAAELYGTQVGGSPYLLLEDFFSNTAVMSGVASNIAGTGLTLSQWQGQMLASYAAWLTYVGSMVDGTARYVLPDGSSPTPLSMDNLAEMSDPLILPLEVNVVVRARDANGAEEMHDDETIVTFNPDGSIHGVAANPAAILAITAAGLVITATIQVNALNSAATADHVNFYATQNETPATPASPTVSTAIAAPNFFALQTATVTWTVPSAGWWSFSAASVAMGVIGALSAPMLMWLAGSVDVPAAQEVEIEAEGRGA